MLAVLSTSFQSAAQASTVLSGADQQRVAHALEENAQVITNTQLQELVVDQPPDLRDEIIRINTEARPIALQVALLIPLVAGLVGLLIHSA